MRRACFHAIATLAFVTAISGGHMSAEGRAQLAEEVSIAARMGLRGEGELQQGPAMHADSTQSAVCKGIR